jgi:hypothetical protein
LRAKHERSQQGNTKKMTIKSLLLIGTLALAGIASAKTYDITLIAPAKAGALELAAGAYSVNVLGSIAVFTNVENRQEIHRRRAGRRRW